MSRPMTRRQTLRTFRKLGIRFHELPDARTHNRNHVGAFDDLNGHVVHHTGDDAPDDLDRRVIHDGRSDLPGPLAQTGGRDDGSVDIVSYGRSNHAGGGDPRVLEAVRAESYNRYPPKPTTHNGGAGSVDGNRHFYGHETYYSGAHRPTRAQYHAAVLVAAARCLFHGWTGRSVIGHKEWSDWKSDPGSVDMAVFRDDVDAVLAAYADKSAPAAPVDPLASWPKARPSRTALRSLLNNTRGARRRRRVAAALAALEGSTVQ